MFPHGNIAVLFFDKASIHSADNIVVGNAVVEVDGIGEVKFWHMVGEVYVHLSTLSGLLSLLYLVVEIVEEFGAGGVFYYELSHFVGILRVFPIGTVDACIVGIYTNEFVEILL